MKAFIYFFFLLFISFSCSSPGQKKSGETNINSNFGALSKSILDATKSYLGRQLKNASINVEGSVINIRGEGMLYVVTAKDINIGQIDEDNSQDAIVSYDVIPTGKSKYRKHLILLNKGEIRVVKDFVSEMKVVQIANRIVYAQIPKYRSNSPLHDCNECQDNVTYKLVGDSLQLFK